MLVHTGSARRPCSTSSSPRPGADGRRARLGAGADPGLLHPRVGRRSSTSAPPPAACPGPRPGSSAALRALRHRCRWPSSRRRRRGSPARASRSTPSRRTSSRSSRRSSPTTRRRARSTRPSGNAARRGRHVPVPRARRRARAPRRRGRRAVLPRRDRGRDLATGCSSAAARSAPATSPPTSRSPASRCAARFRGREVLTNPPPSSGGILIALRARAARPRSAPLGRRGDRRGDGGRAGRAHARSSSPASTRTGFAAALPRRRPARLDHPHHRRRRRRHAAPASPARTAPARG